MHLLHVIELEWDCTMTHFYTLDTRARAWLHVYEQAATPVQCRNPCSSRNRASSLITSFSWTLHSEAHSAATGRELGKPCLSKEDGERRSK